MIRTKPASPEELKQLIAAMESVFVAEVPEHGLINVGFLEYLGYGFDHGAIFADESTRYLAVFNKNLEMLYVTREPDYETNW